MRSARAAAMPKPGAVPVLAALLAATVATAAGLAWDPLLTFGALLGVSLFAATVVWPLHVLTLLLFLGPLDLSFATGGFKSLFSAAGGLDMNGIRLVVVTAGFLLVLLGERGGWRRLFNAHARGYVAFLVFAGITLAVSADPLEGLRLLFKIGWPLLVFLIVSHPSTTREEFDRMVDAVLLGGLFLMLVSPLYVLQGDVVFELSGEARFQGAGTHQNPFSFYLLVVVFLALGRFASRGRLRYLALAVAAVAWIGLTVTRITFLAGLVALALVGLRHALVRRNLRAAAAGAGIAGLIVLVMAPAMLQRTFGFVPTFGDAVGWVRDPVALFTAINWSGREVLWAPLLLAWSTNPLFGLGLGTSSTILRSLFFADEGLVAHNEYLRLGTDAGLMGLGLFAIAMFGWLRPILAKGRAPGSDAEEVALPALAVWVAWGVISITDNAFDYYAPFTQFVGFLVAGCVIGSRESTVPPLPVHHGEPAEAHP